MYGNSTRLALSGVIFPIRRGPFAPFPLQGGKEVQQEFLKVVDGEVVGVHAVGGEKRVSAESAPALSAELTPGRTVE